MGTKKNQNSWEICTKHSLGEGVQFSDNCGITKPSRVKYVLNFDSASALITLTNSINRANCIIQKKKRRKENHVYNCCTFFYRTKHSSTPFAYKAKIGVYDAVQYFLQHASTNQLTPLKMYVHSDRSFSL